MQLPSKKLLPAFTLVELIVVITIVGILSTVGFVSYSGYLSGARDSNRISQLTKLSDSLQVYSASKSLPLPDNAIEITASGTLIAYQGEVGVDVLETIDYTNGGTDPKDDTFFTYYLTKDRKKLQLLTFLEEGFINSQHNILKSHAIDYTERYPKTYGQKLGVFVTSPDNVPAQELQDNIINGLDVVNTNQEYKAIISDSQVFTGTGNVIQAALPNGGCRRIRQSGNFNGSGLYNVYNNGEIIEVYCHQDFIDTNFYTFIDNAGFENSPNGGEWFESYVSSGAARTGEVGVSIIGYPGSVISNQFIYLDPKKNYTISGYFRSQGTPSSRLYYGFAEYDEDFNIILHHHVNAIPNTDTILSKSTLSTDTEIEFADIGGTMCNEWQNYVNSQPLGVAFDTDTTGKYGDLPNRNVYYPIINRDGVGNVTGYSAFNSVVDLGDICRVNLSAPLNNVTGLDLSYPEGTGIRIHRYGGSYNYIAASGVTVPSTWTQYSGTVMGQQLFGADQNQFRPGARFIKLLFLPNHPLVGEQNTSKNLHIDDLDLIIQ